MKFKNIIYISLILTAVILFFQSDTMSSTLNSNQLFLKPNFNTVTCEQDQSFKGFVEGNIGGEEYIYTCPQDINSNNFYDAPNCEVSFKINNFINFGGAEFYKIDAGTEEKINTDFLPKEGVYYEIITLDSGESLKIQMESTLSGFFGLTALNKEDISLKSEFDSYHLVEEGSNIGKKVLSNDCFVTKNLDLTKLKESCEGTACFQSGYPDKLGYGKFINYIAGWDIAPVNGNIETYKNKEVFCSTYNDKYALYEIGEQNTLSGIKKYVDFENILTTVDCCASSPFCTSNFETIKDTNDIIGSECSIFNPAPEGWFNHPTEYGKVVTYKCQNNEVIIDETKTNNCLNCDGVCTEDYECVSAKPPISSEEDTTDYSGLIIIGFVTFITLFIIILTISSIMINRGK